MDAMDLVFPNLMLAISNTIRGVIVAGRARSWWWSTCRTSRAAGCVAGGEDWKHQAFRDFDTILIGEDGEPLRDKKGKPARKGVDLYIKAYMSSFNVEDPSTVDKDRRQIGKVEELMFQYGGGVGAWLTGAATYGIDLAAMTESVWDTIPEWAKLEPPTSCTGCTSRTPRSCKRKLQRP